MTTTVRLLATYDGSPPQTIRDLPDALAASFVAAGNASLDLTGGVRRYQTAATPTRATVQALSGVTPLQNNQTVTFTLPEGTTLDIGSSNGGTGRVQRLDSAGAQVQVWAIGTNPQMSVGPYKSNEVFRVDCDSGVLTVTPTSATAYLKVITAARLGGIKPRLAVLSDSIGAYGYDTANVSGKPYAAITNRSIIDTANALTGRRFNIVARAGVFGNRIDQMAARFAADIAPTKPDAVALSGGSNDIDQGYSADQIFVGVMDNYRQCQALGVPFHYLGTSGMSRTNDNPINSPTNMNPKPSPIDGVVYLPSQEIAKLYALARRAAQTLPGFLYYDMAQSIRDYTGSTSSTCYGAVIPTPGAPYPQDNTHPVPWQVYVQASGLAAYLISIYGPATPDRPSLNGYGTYGDQSSLFGNHLMIGAANTATAPVTGSISDPLAVSRNGTITAACAMAARTDGGPGKQLTLAISGATAVADYVQLRASQSYNKGAGLSAALRGAFKVPAITSGSVYNIIGNLQFLDSGGALLGQVAFGAPFRDFSVTAGLEGYVGPTPITDFGTLESARMTVPVGTATVVYTVKIYTSVGAQLTVSVAELGAFVDSAAKTIEQYRA